MQSVWLIGTKVLKVFLILLNKYFHFTCPCSLFQRLRTTDDTKYRTCPVTPLKVMYSARTLTAALIQYLFYLS